MALKRKPVTKVAIKAVGGDTVIKVSEETAEMMLRNKGEYERVEADSGAAAKPRATRTRKAPAKKAPAKSKTDEKAAETPPEPSAAEGE